MLLVLGAGSWGTALALRAVAAGSRVRLWGRDSVALSTMARTRENRGYLPGVALPPELEIEGDLDAAFVGARDVLLAGPSSAFAELLGEVAGRIEQPRVAWACKGLGADGGSLLSSVAAARLGDDVSLAAISGPTFAREVAEGLPTAVVVAGRDASFVEQLAVALHQPRFRVYRSTDLIGVQIGGAAKNVLAIAAGISDGIGFGANARAALIARGLVEMTRIAEASGGEAHTLQGLAGLGDLVLTATDDQSRNRRFGLALGRGLAVEDAVAATAKVVEGVRAAHAFNSLAERHGLDLPVMQAVFQVVSGRSSPSEAVAALLSREPGPE
ncbi:MAG: NAD(P)H-dependent glycerol-3-phosphate dehydrogenase [Pseudomonadota bacterium]